MGGHVSARDHPQEGWQGAPLLEHRRESTAARWPGARSGTCCIWARSTPRRSGRGASRSRCSTRTLSRRARCRCFPRIALTKPWWTTRSCAVSVAAAPVSAAAVGRVLAGADSCGNSWSWIGSGRSGCRKSRKGTRWDQVLFVLVGLPAALAGQRMAAASALVRAKRPGRSARCRRGPGRDATSCIACHDQLLAHKTALFDHLVGRWRDLFNVEFDVLLYDLTSTYFESRSAVWRRGQTPLRLFSATSAPTACRW